MLPDLIGIAPGPVREGSGNGGKSELQFGLREPCPVGVLRRAGALERSPTPASIDALGGVRGRYNLVRLLARKNAFLKELRVAVGYGLGISKMPDPSQYWLAACLSASDISSATLASSSAI